MKSKSLKIAITFGVFFISFFIPAKISLAFDDLTTHPALTDEIVDFHNLFSGHKITPEEKELIVSGAMEEDIPPRWINHFYDPVRNIGWTGRNTVNHSQRGTLTVMHNDGIAVYGGTISGNATADGVDVEF